ncbi:peptidoglycan-binding protein [Candidatus Woesebacteria bacterium]|nr:peptidoglycan-binding protein [Candidatus Woesebacteria bacterium]
MKKYSAVLALLTLILSIFTGIPTKTEAYLPGCASLAGFSIVNGQPCNTYQSSSYNYGTTVFIPGCTGTTNLYSTVTGQSCYGAQTISPVNPSYTRDLSRGTRGEDVRAVQQVLKSSGFLSGVADGIFGRMTEIAVLNFQSYNNINATGIVDAETFVKMGINSNTTLPPVCPLTYVNGIAQYYCNSNNTVSINSVSGPQSLNVNQQGTWTVSASSYAGGYLTYSVDWGDRVAYGILSSPTLSQQTQSTATFTHTYTTAGSFVPKFTVTNASGQNATSTQSIIVSGYGSSYAPTISNLSPSTGTAGTSVTVYGSGFTTSGNTINFGGVTISNLNSYNGTSLTFTVPAMSMQIYCVAYPCIQPTSQSYNVYVSNANGVSSNATTFTYTTNPPYVIYAPKLSYLSPSSGTVGRQVSVYGENSFPNDAVVYFGGYPIVALFTSSNVMSFNIPSSLSNCSGSVCSQSMIPVNPGNYDVYVYSPVYGTSNSLTFSVVYPYR